MKFRGTSGKRTAVVGGCALAVAASATLFAATSASAAAYDGTLSTTGAWGEYSYMNGSGGYELGARDTLTDGHCAQWQERDPGGGWYWIGSRACTGTEQWVAQALAFEGVQVRVCRTGVGNCSSYVTL